MRAIVWDGQRVEAVKRAEPEAASGMAIVRVTLAGICNTDLEIVSGYMGFRGVLGHELVGVVVDGPAEWKGSRVVAEINFACGLCDACRAGLSRHCPTRSVMGILDADGAFAEYVAVPVANLHRVPDAVDDQSAVFCEPLAAAYEIVEQLALTPTQWNEQRALVLGDGKLGLLVAQVLQAAGARVCAVGRHDEKLRLLAARGIETREANGWTPPAPGSASFQFDLAVDATGSAAGFAIATAATRPRGTVVMKSTVAGAHEIDFAPIVIHELTVLGSRCGPFAPAIAALANGTIDVAPLESERFPLARGAEALREASQPGVLKVLIDCTTQGAN